MSRTISYGVTALWLAGAAILAAQVPDSPTGRMARALAGLAQSRHAGAVEAFLARRVAGGGDAKLRAALEELVAACAGARVGRAERTGPATARVTLELAGGASCAVEYEVEPRAPHRLLALAVTPSAPRAPAADAGAEAPADLAAALTAQVEERVADEAFAGVILVARDGVPIVHRAYGLANRERGLPNRIDTRFDVGSITKLLTRIAAASLLAEGKLELGDTVAAHLPDYPDPEIAKGVTVEHLLEHRSGLGDIFGRRWSGHPKEDLVEPRDFFPLFAGEPLAFAPGSSSAYSNAGYVVLGAVLAAAAGKPYAEIVDERVFAPAGISDSGFPLRDGSDPRLAVGYTEPPGGSGLEANLGLLPPRGCPAGSSSHTALDLLRLDRALRDGRLLDRRWTAWVLRSAEDELDDAALGVAGGAPGVSALLESDRRTTVVVLANLDPPAGEELGLELFARARAGGR